MASAKLCHILRRFLPIAALTGLMQIASVDAQIKLSPGVVPIIDNELNSPVDEPQVIIDEHSSNAVMRATPQHIQHAKDPLVKLVYETREAQRRRLLSTNEHTPWQIMHGMLALREEFLIRHNGQPVSCLEWIQSGPTFENESWFEKTQVRVLNGRGNNFELLTVGRGHPYNKPYAFEGHINQFVAILSMSGVPLDTLFNTPQGPVSMRDMLTYAKLTVNEKEEVTWTLWALSRYLPSDAEWINARGEKWSIERLVKIEAGKSLQGAPCGGTHGLFALAHARNVYLRSGKPLVGVWLEAEQKIRRYIQTARMQQNPNGTLSSNYFRGREYKQDFDKRMASSGHLLEFLMMAMPSQELNAPWVRRAVEATSNDLMMNRKSFVSCSPLYHATSALSIYLDRVAAAAPNMAQAPSKTHSISNSREIKTADAALTTPVVEHPEAVKTPVMESSGVDSNGAPKTLSEPATAVPEVPVPEVPVPEVPVPEVPATPEAPAISVVPAIPETTQPPVPVETPAESLSPVETPPIEPTLPVAESGSPDTQTLTESVPSDNAIVITSTDSSPKVRVFGPQPSPETIVVQKSAVETPKPSTPVPPVPLPEELLIALPESEPVPTPISEAPVPVQSASLPRILPDDKPLPSKEPLQKKKRDGWKATPPERRKVIIVDEKLPDA